MEVKWARIKGFVKIPGGHRVGVPNLGCFVRGRIGRGNGEYGGGDPDLGSVTRARNFASRLGCPLAIIDKRRQRANVCEVMNIIGDVKGKKVILVDDMVDTAGTITKAANLMKEKGAASVRAVATHCIMSGPASERVQDSALEELVFTDSIPYSSRCAKVKQISIADILAETIRRVENNESISSQYLI